MTDEPSGIQDPLQQAANAIVQEHLNNQIAAYRTLRMVRTSILLASTDGPIYPQFSKSIIHECEMIIANCKASEFKPPTEEPAKQ